MAQEPKFEVVHKNPWYEVRRESIVRPTGEDGEFFVVHKGPLVFVVAMTEDEKIVLIKLYRYTTKVESIEVVAGATDGEDSQLAAERELREETGYTAKTWHKLGRVQSENGITDRFADVFLATELTLTDNHEKEEEGITDILEKSIEEVKQMLTDGSITDMGTIGSLFLAVNFLERGR